MKGKSKNFEFELDLKEESPDGVFYFEGELKLAKGTQEIYGYYHDHTRPRPHHVWIMNSPGMSTRSAAYWEKQITLLIKAKTDLS